MAAIYETYLTYTGDDVEDEFLGPDLEQDLSVYKVYLDDVLQVSGFSIDYDTQLVTFDTPPTTGTVVRINRYTDPTPSTGGIVAGAQNHPWIVRLAIAQALYTLQETLDTLDRIQADEAATRAEALLVEA